MAGAGAGGFSPVYVVPTNRTLLLKDWRAYFAGPGISANVRLYGQQAGSGSLMLFAAASLQQFAGTGGALGIVLQEGDQLVGESPPGGVLWLSGALLDGDPA